MVTSDVINALAALAQETRLESFRALVRAGPGGLAAGDLAETLGASASTLSFHLKELERASLVVKRRDGRRIIYAAHYDGFRALIDFLMKDCCQGDPRLCGPYVAKESENVAFTCSSGNERPG